MTSWFVGSSAHQEKVKKANRGMAMPGDTPKSMDPAVDVAEDGDGVAVGYPAPNRPRRWSGRYSTSLTIGLLGL